MAGSADALRGDWRRDYDSWRPEVEAFFNQQNSTEVRVLSWGPGERSPHYNKRASICEDLAATRSNNVFTSEQLTREDARFEEIGDTLLAEQVQADLADIIICLQVDDPMVTGASAEILKFRDDRHIAPKIRLLMPLNPRGGLLHEPSERFPSDKTFRYTEKQYGRCIEIRAKCHQWIEAVRRQKHIERWQKERG